ncbi:hypothetical protein ACSSV4_001673 [Roseovarius sp. MBR-154]|jgi:hypothetical protein
MKKFIRVLFLPMRFLMSLSQGVLILLMVASLALNIAVVTFTGVFSTLSSAVESIAGLRTVRAEHRARLGDLNSRNINLLSGIEELTDENKRLASELDETQASYRKSVDALRDENQRLTKKLAENKVTYRGKKKFAKEAVKDTSGRLAKRVTTAASRNVATVFAEALPVVGIGVIVGATAWEINDSCEMMKDLHELDVAFNPESAIDGTEVCGMRVPDRGEVWRKMRDSPVAAWNGEKEYLPDLPDFSETYASAVAQATSLMCWAFPCDPDVVIPE